MLQNETSESILPSYVTWKQCPHDHVINFKRFQPFKIRKILPIDLYNMSYTCTIGVVCMILVTIKTLFAFIKNYWKTCPSLVVVSGQNCEWLFCNNIFQLHLSMRMTCSISPSFVHWYLVSVASSGFCQNKQFGTPSMSFFIWYILF